MRFLTTNIFDISGAYNYWIEVGAFVFLVCLLVRFLATKKFLSKVNIIFGAAIVVGLFDLILDILGCLCLENAYDLPKFLVEGVNTAFYIFHISFPILLYTFLLFIAGISEKTRRKLALFLIPAAVYWIIILTNPFSGLVFKIDYDSIDGIFKHGVLFPGFYAVTIFYMLLTGVTLYILRDKIEKELLISMLFSIGFDIVMLVIQMIAPNILLTGLAISISCWANYEHLTTASDMVDKVTGVYNYNAFLNYLKDDINFAKKQYVIVCNIAGITEINAKRGILTGNHVYKEIGNFFSRLNNGKIWVFRLHSSRFVLIFSTDIALRMALDNIETRFDSPWKIQDSMFDLNVTGYYVKGDVHAKSVADFFDYLAALDTRVKKNSNNDFIAVNQSVIEEISRIKDVESALKNSINHEFTGFEMHYQPIYQVSTSKFNHSEALIRFTDERLGRISPSEFIPIAESCGLAQRIDRYVLNSCCQFLKKNPDIEFVDINVSASEFFSNPSKEFIKIVKQYGVDPKRICLEVTETATVANPETFEEFMQDMITEGFTFAIDDFGTGYSNISRIVSKNFGIVKLDKSFITDEHKMTQVLKAVVQLLHKLNIPIVIEGVETKDQYETMKQLGIEYVQGWYFSKALPEDDFVQFVAKPPVKEEE